MMKSWTEPTKLNTSHRLTNQARLILKKVLLSDLDIREMCRQLNREDYTQREPPKRIETQSIEKQVAIKHRNTLMLTQDKTKIKTNF